jgi:hypothetical protein
MLIALDYDGTYTADPELWDAFILDARKRNHTVVIATMRFDSEPIHIPDVRVIYTGRRAKREFLDALGLRPQVWIDDTPDWILMGAA